MRGFGAKCSTPICPKPRRVSSTVPDILNPQKCSKHSGQLNFDGKSGIINIVTGKSGSDGNETLCTGCFPATYCSVSPPSRSDNPLIHDVHFIHQMQILSPFKHNKFSNKLGI
uniref:Uncharacterized protein n=1 Tax=Kalanchoe fedtschenkoi TaxID=63787 RepID=A0A7N0UTK7_KALFE